MWSSLNSITGITPAGSIAFERQVDLADSFAIVQWKLDRPVSIQRFPRWICQPGNAHAMCVCEGETAVPGCRFRDQPRRDDCSSGHCKRDRPEPSSKFRHE